MHVVMRHFLHRVLARVRQRPVAHAARARPDPDLGDDPRRDPVEIRDLRVARLCREMVEGHVGPLGITSTCTGDCGRMSLKASVCSVSITVSFGISPRRIFAKMFWSS
jgi:hypothetical protein